MESLITNEAGAGDGGGTVMAMEMHTVLKLLDNDIPLIIYKYVQVSFSHKNFHAV